MTEKDDANFSLDDSAAALYRQLGGIDETQRAFEESALMERLQAAEKELDYFRLLLSDATCLFAGILANSLFSFLEKENEERIKLFLCTIKKIAKYPKFDGKIFCRLRGKQCPSDQIGSESYDYESSFGNFLVDYHVASIVGEREKVKGSAMYAKLMEAFKNLSLMNIFNFSIDVGAGSEEDYQKIERTIRLLLKFHNKTSDKKSLYVHDEYGQPSINLTLLAATNNVPPAALQNLVGKVKPMLLGAKADDPLANFTTVYDVILASKKHREQLKKMPIEVNNVDWLTQNLQPNAPQAEKRPRGESVQISRLILAKYGSNMQMASEVISSISSEGYKDVRTEVMGKRLALATEFLNLTEESEANKGLQNEALQNIEEGLEQVPDETYDNITIDEGKVTLTEEGNKTGWTLHEKILGLLSFFIRRSAIKKKVRDITNKDVKFSAEDYAVIARNFKITELEATHLIDLLKACFDDKGNFRRNFFEKNIPQFVQYDNKVFEFLWHYLKELPKRDGRVAFLNALQLLIPKLKRPQDVLGILLADIFNRTSLLNFSDRNGLMLGTILLRRKNREERSNIELTPEEVLLVRKGLIPEMIEVAGKFLEKNRENVLQKVRRVTENLLKAAVRESFEEDEMQPRFLLFLARELVIFLSLVGGELAQAVVQGVVQEFGHPASPYYKEMKNKENLRHSLQLLQVAARALRRFGDVHASSVLSEIVNKEILFVNLSDEPAHATLVKRVMERIVQPD